MYIYLHIIMNNIETFFNNTPNINKNIYDAFENFNIKNKDLFEVLVNINLWTNDILLTDTKSTRTKQEQFRNDIIKRDNKCVISQQYDENECEACHIISVKDGGTYDINNGLLINLIHHKTFDKNLWCINPETLTIDILTNDRKIVGSIIDYNDKIININPNNIMKLYLKQRWTIYNEYKANYNKN